MSDRKILVTGASGKLGAQVVESLLKDLGVKPSQLIVTTRNAERLQTLAAQGVEVREADFFSAASLENAFQGADSMLLISMDATGPRTQAHLNAVAAAEKAGVDHIVYTSMGAAQSSPVVFAHEHAATENAINQSAIANATILRNNWYFENLPEYFASVLQTGHWLSSAGEGRVAQLSRKDLAFAAASALVKPAQGKVTLAMNGPQSLTHADMAKLIDKVLGTSTTMVHLTDEDYQAQLESFGLPAPIVDLCVTMDQHNRAQCSDGTSEAFETLTGKQPQPFEAWLQEHKADLIKLVA
ncbi:dihydrodipicolinate reductase [Photobacterium aquae]|uniref:Dihydrodipicolinate reductase n=1 Tax=Photobacterium aquae TaxID=1195763 RepID=A0A0J1GTZ2_9GAMM|nr:SDR family oxidoreductase [Photobacterium aquae]KLV03175.1 dihydrodipicolinate reductase [Photobacterium aquae]